jgi:stage V sporulation protein B
MKNRTNTVVINAVILFTAMAVTKLIGAALKIPLTNILGGLGMGYFSTAYSLFSPVYAVTAAALPAVIMRLVAQNTAITDGCSALESRLGNSRNILRAGLLVAFISGVAGTLIIFVIAAPFSQYIAGSSDSLPAMLVIAPSLFFGSLAAVYRGYYEGLSNMLPTAISQIVEAVVKSTTGIFLALWLMPLGVAYAAAGAIAGITIAEFFGLLFLVIRSRFSPVSVTPDDRRLLPAAVNSNAKSQKSNIIRTILTQSLPITLAAVAMNLNPFIDLLTIPNVINAAIARNRFFFLQNFVYGEHGRIYTGDSLSNIGSFIYGSYTGIALPIFAIATTVTAMIAKSALPEITRTYEQKDTVKLCRVLRILFKGTFMVSLPVCFGLAALANPILSLLYPARPAEVHVSTLPLIILGIGGISLILAGTLFGIFLAIGRVDLQIKLMLLGAVIKLGGNLLLIRIPHVNVAGAAISTVICYTVISILGLVLLKRVVKDTLKIRLHLIQPLIFALLCGITAYTCYYHTFYDRPSLLRLAMSVSAGALAYLVPTMIADRKYIPRLIMRGNNK